jgi:hypothetical protein
MNWKRYLIIAVAFIVGLVLVFNSKIVKPDLQLEIIGLIAFSLISFIVFWSERKHKELNDTALIAVMLLIILLFVRFSFNVPCFGDPFVIPETIVNSDCTNSECDGNFTNMACQIQSICIESNIVTVFLIGICLGPLLIYPINKLVKY